MHSTFVAPGATAVFGRSAAGSSEKASFEVLGVSSDRAEFQRLAFLHELGHALVHQLQMPITGKEEDAVDQLASVILIESGSGIEMALDGGRAFLLNDAKGYSADEFWGEHSFEKQRYHSIVCMAYGAAPKKRAALSGGKNGLPTERAQGCPAEYARIKTSWQTLLAEHAKPE